MSENDEVKQDESGIDAALEAVGSVLIRAFAISIVIMLLWCGAILIAPEKVFNLHANFFGISREQFSSMNYYGIAMFKMFAIGIFLLPYIGIRWTLASRQ